MNSMDSSIGNVEISNSRRSSNQIDGSIPSSARCAPSVELKIPSRVELVQHDISSVGSLPTELQIRIPPLNNAFKDVAPPLRRKPFYIGLCSLISQQFGKPSRAQLRWPLHIGISAGITFAICTLIDPIQQYLGIASALGVICVTLPVEATTGGALRRAWLSCTSVTLGCCIAFGLYTLSTWNTLLQEEWYASIFMTISAILLVMPFSVVRYVFPRHTSGLPIGISISENVLLNSFSRAHERSAWRTASTAVSAVAVGVFCATVVPHFVLPKAARPYALESLSTIITCMAEILEPLATMVIYPETTDSVGYSSSSALLLPSYQHLLSSAHRLFEAKDTARYQAEEEYFEIKESPPRKEIPTMDVSSAPRLFSSSEEDFGSTKIVDSMLLNFLEPNKKKCEKMMESINRCQTLLSGQKDLVESAKHELSCRKPHRFPASQYLQMLTEVQTLFVHIASLVVAINLYFITIAYNAKQQMPEPMSSSTGKSRSLIPKRYRKSHMSKIHKVSSSNELREKRRFFHHGGSTYRTRISSNSYSQTNAHAESNDPTYSDLKLAAQRISKALLLLGECLRDRSLTTAGVRLEIDHVTEVIATIEARRTYQREKFADIIITVLEADVTGSWSKENPHALDWKGAIGIDSDLLRSMSEEESLRYWEAYWLCRDRLSTSSQTLHVLGGSLVRCCDLLDAFVEVHPKAAVFPVIP